MNAASQVEMVVTTHPYQPKERRHCMKNRNKTEEASRAQRDELAAVIRAVLPKLIAQAIDAEAYMSE